jgi:glucose-6-phosphate isomerase
MSNKRLTARPEWKAIHSHRKVLESAHIADFFKDNGQRFSQFSQSIAGLLFDYSKNRINAETIEKLVSLAKACDLEGQRDALFQGAIINITENRAALHMALRGSFPSGLEINNENVSDFVRITLAHIKILSQKIRKDKKITDVIHIGIGGSDLGPRMVCRALAPHANGPDIHFLPNIDGQAFSDLTKKLNPKNTLVIIVSKTFTTLETMSNASSVKDWMASALSAKKLKERLIGVTMNERAALDFGIEPGNILPLRDWIGGRFSLWSAVGLPIAIALGFEQFERLLAGAKDADEHFLNVPFEKNIPVLLGLIGIWHRNFWNYPAHALLPYAHNLEHLKTYIQQLDMESNGKSVDRDGKVVDYATAPIIIGEVGTNAQHTFMQLLHQSNEIIPADFILVAQPEHSNRDHHIKLLANALAQSKALMEGQINSDSPHMNFEGNRPSSTFILDRLDAYSLGLLLAFYEHKIFVQGAIWNINSFDQWGVELGKTIANDIIENFEKPNNNNALDGSTADALQHIHKKFTNS